MLSDHDGLYTEKTVCCVEFWHTDGQFRTSRGMFEANFGNLMMRLPTSACKDSRVNRRVVFNTLLEGEESHQMPRHFTECSIGRQVSPMVIPEAEAGFLLDVSRAHFSGQRQTPLDFVRVHNGSLFCDILKICCTGPNVITMGEGTKKKAINA